MNHTLERAVIAVCLLLHGGCIGQAREDIEATKMGLDEKIHAVAAKSAVHLQEDVLSWHVFRVREERIYRIVQALTKFLIIYPTLLVHSNPTGPLLNLVVTKLLTCIFYVKTEIISKLLPLC